MKWIGEGVLRIKGKDYGYGDDIPTKGISPERIAQLKKLGKIGEIPVAGPNEADKLKARIAEVEAMASEAQENWRKLETENVTLKAEIKKLTGSAKQEKKK